MPRPPPSADGDSTDYDSLPSPPRRGTASLRVRGGTRPYGKRATRVPVPVRAAAGEEAEGEAARREREKRGGESGTDREGEPGRKQRGGQKTGGGGKSSKGRVNDGSEVEEEQEEVVGLKKRKGGSKEQPKKRRKSTVGAVPSSEQPPPSATAPPGPLPPSQASLSRPKTLPPNHLPSPHIDTQPPSRPSQTAKIYDSTLPLAEALAQHLTLSIEAQMTPRSRSRALRDKSNRRSLAATGGETTRSAAPSSTRGLDSPRGTSRRPSLAAVCVGTDSPARVSVFRDPSPSSAAAPPPLWCPPSLAHPAPTLTDLPARRRPLARTHSQPTIPTIWSQPSHPRQSSSFAGGALPLPRSPGGALLRALSASPRLPLLSRQRPRAALASASSRLDEAGGGPSRSLTVPGAPQPGEVPRLPAPWALAASLTSSPAVVTAGDGFDDEEGFEGEGGGERPVFRFTTTQFADLPSFRLSLSAAHGALGAERRGDGEEESGRVGMESSFMLFEDESGEMSGAGWKEGETTSMAVDGAEGVVEAGGSKEGEKMDEVGGRQEAMEIDALVVEEATNGQDNVVGDEYGEAEETIIASAVSVDSLDQPTPGHSASRCSSPSVPSSSHPFPPSPTLPNPSTPFHFTSTFMPPRRSRSTISAPSPSGPPSSEDDLAYYLRTTGTYSSEDDLPLSSPLGSSAEEDRLAEAEVGRAVKPSSRQRQKRVEAHEEAKRAREKERVRVRGLKIGDGKEGRRKGWKREILSPIRKYGVGRSMSVGGYEGGDEEEDEEEDELTLAREG